MKPTKINILGVNFDYLTFGEAQELLLSFLDGDVPRSVFTPNPEIVMMARKDAEFMALLNASDVVLPDGIGIVLASRLGKQGLSERVTGYDITLALMSHIAKSEKTVYFYGSKDGVAELAKSKLEAKFPGLKIVGTKSGFQPNTA